MTGATRPDIPAATRRWRRKPSAPVDAIQWTGANFAAVKDFASGALGIGEVEDGALPLWVVKSKAVCNVQRGDWIIREADGDGFYPCAADVFAATYAAATITAEPSATATGPAGGGIDDREPLGRLVHAERLAVNAEREKPFGVEPWERRTTEQRELDMRIGSAVAARAVADAGGEVTAARTDRDRMRMERGALASHLPAVRDALSAAVADARYEAQAKPYRAALEALEGAGMEPAP